MVSIFQSQIVAILCPLLLVSSELQINQSEPPTWCEPGVGCYSVKDVVMQSFSEWFSENWRPIVGGCVTASTLMVLPLMFLIVAVITNSHDKTNIIRRFPEGVVVVDATCSGKEYLRSSNGDAFNKLTINESNSVSTNSLISNISHTLRIGKCGSEGEQERKDHQQSKSYVLTTHDVNSS